MRITVQVSDNVLPGFTLSWLASEAEAALDRDVSAAEAAAFRATPMGRFFRLLARRHDPRR